MTHPTDEEIRNWLQEMQGDVGEKDPERIAEFLRAMQPEAPDLDAQKQLVEEARESFGSTSVGALGALTPTLGQQDIEGVVEIAERELGTEVLAASYDLYPLLLLGHWALKLPEDWRAWSHVSNGGADPNWAIIVGPDGKRALSVLRDPAGSWRVQSVSSANIYAPIASWPIGTDIPTKEGRIFVVPIEAGDCGRHWPLLTEKKKGEPRNRFTGYLVRRVDTIAHEQVLAEFGEKAAACARQDRDSIVFTIEQVPEVQW